MKLTRPSRILLSCLAAALMCVAAIPLGGCAGDQARTTAGAPALVLASKGVQADVAAGIATHPPVQQPADTATANAFFAAVAAAKESPQWAGLLPQWPTIKAWATEGINARIANGTLTTSTAASLRERLAQYESVLTKSASGP